MTGLEVIYSIDARLGGGGIGHIAERATDALRRAGAPAQLFVSSDAQRDTPRDRTHALGALGRGLKYLAMLDRSGLIYHLEGCLFDAWVAAHHLAGDIFHGWNGSCLWSLRRARRRGMRTVVERASSHPATQRALLQEEYARWGVSLRLPTWNYRRLVVELEEADYITTPSDFARESMLAAGVPATKLIHIPFGFDVSRFSPGAPPPSQPFRALFAGQISLRKGVPYLLDAWRCLGWDDAELWLAGDIAADFQSLRHRWAGLAGIRFLGHTAELPALMRQCHLFVFPSIEEGSALVTYEALASGMPVITTPNAGSVVRDGQEGFIVPIRDVETLCQRMQKLKEDGRLRTTMGSAARARAEHFTWDAYGRQLVDGYRRIAAAAGRPA